MNIVSLAERGGGTRQYRAVMVKVNSSSSSLICFSSSSSIYFFGVRWFWLFLEESTSPVPGYLSLSTCTPVSWLWKRYPPPAVTPHPDRPAASGRGCGNSHGAYVKVEALGILAG